MSKTHPLSYIELSTTALRKNLAAIKSLLRGEVKVAAVVKANAYGHGLSEVVQGIAESVDYFQIDDLDELRRIREVTDKPVLLLGYVGPEDIEEALTLGCEMAVYGVDRLPVFQDVASRMGVSASVHLAVDSFLGREGILPDEVPDFIAALATTPAVSLAGVYAHFANIEDTADFSHASKQIDAYEKVKQLLADAGFTDIQTHIAATSGILAYEIAEGHNSIVRLGIGLYGLWPSEELHVSHNDTISFEPVLRWISHVAQVKELPIGYTIGYGLTYITVEPTTIALIPQGYSDGYDRKLSNSGEVLIQGTRCKVLGRVAMNMMVVDVTHLGIVVVGEEVVLLGKQGGENISAEELAEKVGTINYEIVARINPLLPRETI